MLKIDAIDKHDIQRYVSIFETYFNRSFINVVFELTSLYKIPSDIQAIVNQLKELRVSLGSTASSEPVELGEHLMPCLKRALLYCRKLEASDVENYRKMVRHHKLLDDLNSEVAKFDKYLLKLGLQSIEAMEIPRTTDYISIQTAIKRRPISLPTEPRELDEKFNILYAPKHLYTDLRAYREVGELRDTSLTLAFIDIDNFKKFNSKYSETTVDQELLPRFMSEIERLIYGHGYAYRMGGDEYIVLLPNISEELAIMFLDALKIRLASINYWGIKERTTVSIGCISVGPDCHLTDEEVVARANQAKIYAKKGRGKNVIATYQNNQHTNEALRIVKLCNLEFEYSRLASS
ncbi:MAG: GGDEF domain-containing protein [Acidobacteria bacterium]|nr:GGDEF domain-containing protein [Acidobacteriota bacterium]